MTWRHARSLSITFVLLVITSPLTAQNVWVSDVDLEHGMIRITPVHDEALGDVGTTGLRLKLYIENTSREVIKDVMLAAYIYSEDGQARGFHDLSLGTKLSTGKNTFRLVPGERKLVYLNTPVFQTIPSDKVVLIPIEIQGNRNSWKIEKASLESVESRFDELDIHLLNVGEHRLNLKAGGDLCITRCDARELSCNSTCSCGVNEFNCSCSPAGGMNSTCKCFMCPP